MLKTRFSIKTLMALVAVIALGIWGEQMRQRRAYCLRKSLEHRSKLLMASFHMAHRPLSAKAEERLRMTYPHAAWHLNASDTYLRHVSRPWLALPPEPVEPHDFPPGRVLAQ
jgi:hypothetical protein